MKKVSDKLELRFGRCESDVPVICKEKGVNEVKEEHHDIKLIGRKLVS